MTAEFKFLSPLTSKDGALFRDTVNTPNLTQTALTAGTDTTPGAIAPDVFSAAVTSIVQSNIASKLDADAQAADSALLGGQPPSFYTDIVSRLGYVPVQPNQLKGIALSGSANDLIAGTVPDSRLPTRLGIDAKVVTDWNDAIETGWYAAEGTAANSPVAFTLIGQVVAYSSASITQTVTGILEDLNANQDTKTYRREMRSGVWGSWYRIRLSETEQQSLWDARYLGITATAADSAKLGGVAAASYVQSSALAAIATSGSANDLTTGTIPDARLPTRIGGAGLQITDWNTATSSGWYWGSAASNGPTSGLLLGVVDVLNVNYATQTVWDMPSGGNSDTKAYRRSHTIGDGWSAWYRLRLSETEQQALWDARYLQSSTYTASDILAKLLTVDGIASGLDAQYLGGQSYSAYALLASPAFSGTPTAPTATPGTNTTQVATTAFVQSAVSGKLDASSYTASDILSKLLTVDGATSGLDAQFLGGTSYTGYAKLASPTFTGVPAAPTATAGTNTTQIATTAFVQSAVAGKLDSSAYTASDILSKLLTVDGISSGLDAQYLGGQSYSAYTLSSSLAAVATSGSASDLTTGTVPDARLPAALSQYGAQVADWNTATTDGFYRGVAGTVNGPPAAQPNLKGFVLNHSAGWGEQTVFDPVNAGETDTLVWRRQRINNVWGAWYRLRLSQTEQQALWDARYLGISATAADSSKLGGVAAASYVQTSSLATVATSGSASDLSTGTLADARLPLRLSNVISNSVISDWNNATANGWYRGLDAANAPADLAGQWAAGLVQMASPVFGSQIVWRFDALSVNDQMTYRREMAGGTWGAWYRLRLSETEQQALWDARYAPLVSPALTGTPTAPTAAQATNTTQIATTAFVKSAIAALVASSPATLDTLNELAAALGDDPNFATTMTTALAGKLSTTGTAADSSKLGGQLPSYYTDIVSRLGYTPANNASLAAVAFDGSASSITTGTLPDARLPGRLGLNAQGSSPKVADWNDAISSGWYWSDSSTLNSPAATYHVGVVDAYSTVWITQTVHSITIDGDSDTKVYRRDCNNGTWSAWYRLRWSETEQRTLWDARYLLASSYTAADVLSKIKTVDGSGSGLDADTLDGHDTTYFQTALGYTPANVAGDTFTGQLKMTNSVEIVTGLGNVFRMKSGGIAASTGYGVFWRIDGSTTYLMRTALDDPDGSWDSPFIFTIPHATKLVSVAGDPTTALGIATKQYVDNSVSGISADYGAGNAALGQGDIGTYALAQKFSIGNTSPGGTLAASNLRLVTLGNVASSSTLSGTWRLMSNTVTGSTGGFSTTACGLWLRIA